jgi:hypothetical protein
VEQKQILHFDPEQGSITPVDGVDAVQNDRSTDVPALGLRSVEEHCGPRGNSEQQDEKADQSRNGGKAPQDVARNLFQCPQGRRPAKLIPNLGLVMRDLLAKD